MEQQESFQGSPWGEPSEDWNRPAYWHDYYTQLLAEADSWRCGIVVHRQVELLIRMLTNAGELPRQSPQTLLDAGCGIALIPHILASWGFRVTAVDSCPVAVEVAARQQPSEEELARCVPIWEPCSDSPVPRSWTLVEDPARSLRRLREFAAPGGSVSYLVGDWFADTLRPGTFGVIHCRNSLRLSTKPYWRRSLQRFRELLSPGGVLLLENVNAIGVQDEVEALVAECGFVTLAPSVGREAAGKYLVGMWPTG